MHRACAEERASAADEIEQGLAKMLVDMRIEDDPKCWSPAMLLQKEALDGPADSGE